MSLIDKLTASVGVPDEMDLLEFFGIKPGDPLSIGARGVTVGDETVSIADARLALSGGRIAQPPGRTVSIGDLEPEKEDDGGS